MAGEWGQGKGQDPAVPQHSPPECAPKSQPHPLTSAPLSEAGALAASAGYQGRVGGHSHDTRSGAAAAPKGQ